MCINIRSLVLASIQILVEAGTTMRLNISISYFPVAMMKYDQSKLRKKEFILAYSSRV